MCKFVSLIGPPLTGSGQMESHQKKALSVNSESLIPRACHSDIIKGDSQRTCAIWLHDAHIHKKIVSCTFFLERFSGQEY